MKSNGVTLKEIQNFFEYLKKSKSDNEMFITMTNSMCKDLQFMIENLSKYKDKLEEENKQLKEKIKSADEFCDRYMGVNLELFDIYELLNKIREILGDKENEE